MITIGYVLINILKCNLIKFKSRRKRWKEIKKRQEQVKDKNEDKNIRVKMGE